MSRSKRTKFCSVFVLSIIVFHGVQIFFWGGHLLEGQNKCPFCMLLIINAKFIFFVAFMLPVVISALVYQDEIGQFCSLLSFQGSHLSTSQSVLFIINTKPIFLIWSLLMAQLVFTTCDLNHKNLYNAFFCTVHRDCMNIIFQCPSLSGLV